MAERPAAIGELIGRMDTLLASLEAERDPARYFLAAYRRITLAVRDTLEQGGFDDPEWVERWDIEFAALYLDAIEQWQAGQVPARPWETAFRSGSEGPRVPPLRHVLLGMNAHINWDLPQALLAVITDEEFDDPAVVARKSADHARIDEILVERVKPEDVELKKVEEPGDRTLLDRLLTPFNRAGTKRFLAEGREKSWRNAQLLSRARRRGPEALAGRLDELERLSEARVADLRQPGQVLLKLAVKGFGVALSE